ncbi:sodium channel protein type 5 subunit alpha-like isoform X2 [Pezoporus flaviventris]|uniref:sodium channel protein type 5 subunit alpha-like isoform X2 n=2 Tax=Pezoporus flaviventris TaxID=889875 RepID=UPI002AB262A2|nr:sodium channel protein type 5 subunit alpha-like isoform X2 [Pezoporus flaviventris]
MDPLFCSSETSNFRPFTRESLAAIEKRIAEKKSQQAKAKRENEDKEVDKNKLTPKLDLKTCKKLPSLYGDLPVELIGEPLEDIDSYYSDHKTFMVLNKSRIIYRFTATSALCIISPFNPVRKAAIKIMIHSLFTCFIICTVVLNCVSMTVKLPHELYWTEYIFTGIYTCEILIKVVAAGFVWNEFTFLRDPWNCMDFVTTVVIYATVGKGSALRTFRVLRTLKAISVIPGLKVIVNSLIESVKRLTDVLIFTVFCLSVFALIGLQLFMGNLTSKCVLKNTTYNDTLCKDAKIYVPDTEDVCARMNKSSEILLCGFSSQPENECPQNYTCKKIGKNPDFGYTSFDHFGWAFLSLFRLMTQDYWERLYRQTIRTSGKSYVLFFMAVIFLCSFYLFNLILAVVTLAYKEQNEALEEKEKILHDAYQILKEEQMLAVGEGNRALHVESKMSAAELKNSEEKEVKKEKPILSKSSILSDHDKDGHMFQSQPVHCHKKLRQILLSYELSVDSINDPFQRQRLMSAATIITDMQKSKITCPSQWKHLARKCLIWNCCSFWRAVKEKVKMVILDPSAETLIMVCIIANTFFMALKHPGVNHDYKELFYRSDLVFTLIFTAEMILKIIALDPYNYFQQKWNIFDSIVVMIDLISFEENLSYFRLLRIFKLAKFWPALNTLMKIILNSVGALGNLTLVLIVTIFIFAVVGKQVLGPYYEKYSCKISTDAQLRWHMKDFYHSFLIIFRILCGEWIETMWECMEVAGKGLCLPIFLVVLVIGNLVVLNLFIALLLNSFNTDSSTDQEESGQMTKSQITIVHIRKGLQSVKDRILGRCCKAMKRSLKTTAKKKTLVKISAKDIEENNYAMIDVRKDIDNSCLDLGYYNTERNCSVTMKYEEFLTSHSTCVPIAVPETYTDEGGDEHSVCTETEYRKQGDRLRHRRECRSSSVFSQISGTSETLSCVSEIHQKKEQKEKCDGGSYSEASTVDPVILLETFSQPQNSHLPKDCFTGSCVECFPCCALDTTRFPGRTWWNFRKTCYRIVKHSWFEHFIIFMIILSSAALAFEDIHLQERQKVKMLLEFADKIFTYIFFMEMLLKWVAYGLHSYFTNAWCWLDFILVCLSFVSWGLSTTPASSLCSSENALKSLRTLKALRPLRALSRFEGIKVVVNALLGAIPSILNVLLVCIVFWLLFNIAGVKLFGKKFWKCTLSKESISSVWNRNDCTHFNGIWTNTDVNFDNVGMGYLALLQVATFKGWMDIMYAAVDSRQIDEQPKFEAFPAMYMYFVIFIIFGSFFMLNLFIGVVISNFNQQRKKISGKDIFLTEEQKKYYNALKKLGSKKPQKLIPKPLNMFQGLLFDIVSHKAFDITVAVFICLNMVIMMAENNQDNVKDVLNKINLFFVAVFTGECVIKILALRHYFFTCGWNIFDLAVVILSLVSTGLAEGFQTLFSPTLLRIFRLARIGRILRLIRQARGIRALLFALLMSLPALFNIGLLLFLVMFIYAVVGMTNFACIGWEGGINNLFNFQTFDSSILCLFQITTSAGWDGLLAPLLKESNSCAPNLNLTSEQKKSCRSRGVGIFYFVSYVIISFLIVVNMYIAVILENFNVATEESTGLLCEDDFDMFYETWGKFDPQATQFIEYSALSDFADALAEPLRIPKPNKIQLMSMDLPLVSGDKIHCLDILLAFSKRVWGESGDLRDLEMHIEEKFMADDPAKTSCKPITTTLKRKQEEVSARIIQKAFRRYLVKRSSKKKPFLYHRKRYNSAVFEESTCKKESLIASMLNKDNDRKLDKSWTASSISLPLFYDGIAETDSNNVDTQGCPRLQHF